MTNLTWHTYRTLGIPAQTTHIHAQCDTCGWNTDWTPNHAASAATFVAWANNHTHDPNPLPVSRYTITITAYDTNTVSTATCNHCAWEHTDTNPIRDIVETHWNINHNPQITGQ